MILLYSLTAGILYFLSFPPFNLEYLIFPSLTLFYWTLSINSKPFYSGFVFAATSYSVILFGIQSIGYEAWIPLLILMGLIYGTFGYIFNKVSTISTSKFLNSLAIISMFELVRLYFPFNGFPWGLPGTVLVNIKILKPLFQAFGTLGVSLLISSICLAIVFISDKTFWKNYIFVFTSLLIISVLAQYQLPTLNNGTQTTIAIVQGNSPCPGAKNFCQNERQLIYESHLRQTMEINKNVDLVVWPESSTGFNNDPFLHSDVLLEISNEANRLNSYFLIGGDRPIDNNYFENYGLFIDNKGLIVDQYLKQHPVPFGEYIPFRKYLDWIPPLALVPRDMIRGTEEKIFDLNNTKIATVISFEGSFQRYIRNSVKNGAEIVVILTNQASYGESAMSDQFIMMSRANAISNNRPIVHAAITGKSAFISNDGAVLSETQLFETITTIEKVTGTTGTTLFSKFGNYLNLLTVLISLILWFKKRIKLQADEKVSFS